MVSIWLFQPAIPAGVAQRSMHNPIFMSDLQTSTPNTESFAALFEESLTRQDARRRSDHRRSRAHRPQLRGRQRRPEVRSYIPIEEFLNDQGELEVQSATSSPWPSTRSKTATATPSCRATRPSAWHRG
jgi:small subunit ribosomal protein S1